jgi:dephospho-CoA kinase
MKKKLVVGLTGGFGSGKSTVTGIFRKLGAAVIDADKLAHGALKKSSPVFRKIAVLFPEALSRCGRHFRREKIAEKVFSDPKKRERLEALVHPFVLQEMKKKIAAAKRKVVIAEIPLLFEAGFDRFFDKVVAVTCRPSVKRTRLAKKGFTRQEIKAREKAQMPESLKSKKADLTIDNSSSVSITRRNAERLWKRLTVLAKPR